MTDSQNSSQSGSQSQTKVQDALDLTKVKTLTGKTIKDFIVPEILFDGDKELIKLIMESEAMDDGEKQYWFNLTKVMNDAQKEKLYDILRRERRKLNEIRGIKEQIDPVEAKRKAEEQARIRQEQQERLAQREKAHEEQEKVNEDELLESVDW